MDFELLKLATILGFCAIITIFIIWFTFMCVQYKLKINYERYESYCRNYNKLCLTYKKWLLKEVFTFILMCFRALLSGLLITATATGLGYLLLYLLGCL